MKKIIPLILMILVLTGCGVTAEQANSAEQGGQNEIVFRDKDAKPLLTGSLLTCDVEAARKLLEDGADINYVSESGKTALMAAISIYGSNSQVAKMGGDEKVAQKAADCKDYIQFLLENGADVSLANSEGKTARDEAKKYKVNDEIEALFSQY